MAINFEAIKDFGRKVVGQGAEVEFKNDVKQHETDHGVSFEEAQKEIFRDRVDAFTREMRMVGGADKKSEGSNRLKAAMNESLSSAATKFLLESGANKTILRPLPPLAISPAEHAKAANYFAKKFAGKNPGFSTVDECARQTKIISELARRFNADPLLSTPSGLEAILRANPDLAADMGRILLSKDLLAKIEKSFDKKVKWDQRKTELRTSTTDSLNKLLFKNTGEWLRSLGKARPNFNSFMNVAWATGKFVGKETWELAGIGARSIEAIGSGIGYAKAQMSADSLRKKLR